MFLEGCDLPLAWSGRGRFTVAELGFGTGLNIAALLHLWKRTRPEGSHLSIFSVEAHPLTCAEAARALTAWPELSESVAALLSRWPQARSGFHRLPLDDYNATLDLYIGEVGEALSRWSGMADAWFLDGFAPSRNPAMWREEVLASVARLSAPGARLASFTVAGGVRRGLASVGFQVLKRPGFGAKAERLEARWPETGRLPRPRSLPRVAIIGAGIAGAALARAFARQGIACTVIEAEDNGAGASGNPAALVTPRLDAGFGPAAELHAQAFAYAADSYQREVPEAIIAEGALQLGANAAARDRFARLCAWNGFRAGGLRVLEDADAARRLAEPPAPNSAAALLFDDALVIEPSAILRVWLALSRRIEGRVAVLEPDEGCWRCLDASGRVLAVADVVCLAAGSDIADLLEKTGLRPVRGQLEFTSAPVFDGQAAAWGAYAIPTREGGVLFGASHRRGDRSRELRAEETVANLEMLATRRPGLAERVHGLTPGALRSRAGVRAATADHLPLAGAWGIEGLHVLGGLGGRGFTLAPLLAEHVAAAALGAPSPLSSGVAHSLRGDRYRA